MSNLNNLPAPVRATAEAGANAYAATLVAVMGDVVPTGRDGYGLGFVHGYEVNEAARAEAVARIRAEAIGFANWIGDETLQQMTEGRWEDMAGNVVAETTELLYDNYLDRGTE